MAEEHANPAVPSTVGAFLAEEVTMDPLSPLPSFLEMMMIEETNASAQRALESGLEAVVDRASRMSRSPSRWRARFAQCIMYIGNTYSAELRLLITYLMNRQCLRSSACSSVAESLYGGRRAKLGAPGENGERTVLALSERDKTRLALVLTFGPYIQERLDELYQRLKQQSSSRSHCTNIWDKMRSLFVAAYPFLHMTKEGTVLAYQFMFLLGKTFFFHPSSHLLGQVVRRTTLADVPSNGSSQQTDSPKAAAADTLRKGILLGLSTTIIMGWLRQFRRLLRVHEQESSDLPPPPLPAPVQLDPKKRLRPLSNPAHCPLCRQPRINPAAATSGYVFCHRCLVMFVRQYAKCPLTGMQCPESRIVRIYEPSSLR